MTRLDILDYINNKDVNVTLKNVAMFLIDKKHFAPKLSMIDDVALDLLIDNLFINNEIIDKENINEYSPSLFTLRQDAQIRQENKILLLNYYTIKNDLKHCSMLLDNVNYYGFNL